MHRAGRTSVARFKHLYQGEYICYGPFAASGPVFRVQVVEGEGELDEEGVFDFGGYGC